MNARIYDTVNNGVYKAGFATTQEAYDEAVVPLFETLDWLEATVSRAAATSAANGRRRPIGGSSPTLLRFDPVYVGHFKCNLRRLVDYPALWSYTRELYQVPGVADTVDFDHIKRHYYESHRWINPTGIVPRGPLVDFNEAPDRVLP